ncbi:MAG TPA: hypothetical protein VFF88_00980 [Methylocella sp.]|nr:hypothetical protein [Methylocella sp.]
MFTMIVLICLSALRCNELQAEDIIIVKHVPLAACGLAGQTVLAGQAGDRAAGHTVKIICRGR